jgi:hypothetical protein
MTKEKRLARKKARKKKAPGKDFYEKMLSGSKVKRILEGMKVDPKRFQKLYESDTSRVSRKMRTPENYQVVAVQAFLESGDKRRLMKSLGTENRQTADAAVSRIIQWKAINS